MMYGRLGGRRPPCSPVFGVSLAVLGFCLAHASTAAAGAATVNPNQNTTYQLNPAQNPITFGPETEIQVTSGDGVFDNSSTKWTIVNYGSIVSDNLFGVWTDKATSLANHGTISGPLLGVALQTGSVITNAKGASILGGAEIQGDGTITNSGTITGEAYLSKGAFTNNATGVISSDSETALFSAQGSTVTNAGVISNSGGDALYLGDPTWGAGSLDNTSTGQITAEGVAVDSMAGSKSLTNAGRISGLYGVAMLQGGKLVNQTGGMISGSEFGVGDFGSYSGYATTITNQADATITGSIYAIDFRSNAGLTTLTNQGAITSLNYAVEIAGGSITNQANGVISGGDAIVAASKPTTVTNSGQITGAIFLDEGGTITNNKTGVISGYITGDDAAITFANAGIWRLDELFGAFTTEGGTITNTGTIEGEPGQTSPQFYEISGPTVFKNGSGSTAGTVNLANGVAGDTLLIESPFKGATGYSTLILDAALGEGIADELELGAGSSGQTLIRIQNTNTGPGASETLTLVTGVTAASNFALDPKGPGYDKKYKGIDDGLYLYTLQFQGGDEKLVGGPGPGAQQLPTFESAGQNILANTNFSPSGGSGGAGGSAGFAGFTGDGPVNLDRPMFWTAAVNTLAPDPVSQGHYVGLLGGGEMAAPPSLRLSEMQSAGGIDTGYDQGLAMLKGGVDLIRRQDGATSFSLGVATAYVQSDQRFTDGGTAMFYSGVVYGGYADYRVGSAYLTANFKSAMLKTQYQAPWVGDANPSAGLTATAIELDGGFNLGLAPGWRLEPIASMAASRTSMSDLQIASDVASFGAGYTGWANAGARLEGTTRVAGLELDSLFTARAWDRFGDNAAYLTGLGSGSPLIDRISGVSGEVAAELRLSAGRNLYAFVQTSAQAGAAQTSTAALLGLSFRW
jgi:hypothetical protein